MRYDKVYESWFRNITTEWGKPKFTAVLMLGHILTTCDMADKDEMITCNQDFMDKFGICKDSVRKNLVQLEELGLIERKTFRKDGTNYLNLKLNREMLDVITE